MLIGPLALGSRSGIVDIQPVTSLLCLGRGPRKPSVPGRTDIPPCTGIRQPGHSPTMLAVRFCPVCGRGQRGVPWVISIASDECCAARSEVLSQVLLEFFPVAPARLAGPLLPRENADSSNAIEADPPQRDEKFIPVDLALADIQMLMYSRWRPWGVHDVAQARGRRVIEGVSKVYVGQQVTGVLHDFGHVAAHMECVRCAVQERNVRGVNPANYVDRG